MEFLDKGFLLQHFLGGEDYFTGKYPSYIWLSNFSGVGLLRLSPGCFRSLDEKTIEIQNASNWPTVGTPLQDAQMYMIWGMFGKKVLFSCEMWIISEIIVDRCSFIALKLRDVVTDSCQFCKCS